MYVRFMDVVCGLLIPVAQPTVRTRGPRTPPPFLTFSPPSSLPSWSPLQFHEHIFGILRGEYDSIQGIQRLTT
jgi:hypothetical protein